MQIVATPPQGLDPVRAEALAQAVAFISTFQQGTGRNAGQIVHNARVFEYYLRTSKLLDLASIEGQEQYSIEEIAERIKAA